MSKSIMLNICLLACLHIISIPFLAFLYSSAVNAEDIVGNNDISHLVDFHDAIRNHDIFNYSVATFHLSAITNKTVLNMPLYGRITNEISEIPLLHHLMNLFFTAQTPKRQELLEQLITLVIASDDVSIDTPFRNDPHVLLKALLVRNVGLATQFSSKLSSLLTEIDAQHLFSQLYSIPCEPVPLAKLLLHADTLLKPRRDSTTNDTDIMETAKHLLLGAAPGQGSKPSVKAKDLFQFSSSYVSLVQTLGSADARVSLLGLVSSLDDAASATHKKLLSFYFDSDTFSADANDNIFAERKLLALLKMMCKRNEDTNRNLFHSLAASGAIKMMNEMTSTIKSILSVKYADKQLSLVKIKRMLTLALKSKDYRGYIPIQYTAVRYGVNSDIFEAMENLHLVVGVPVDKDNMLSANANVRSENKNENPIYKNKNRDEQSEDGGWDASTLLDDKSLDTNAFEPTRCDIEEYWDDLPSSDEFFFNYVRTAKPVIFRRASNVDSSIRKAFRKKEFLAKYGSDIVSLSAIPYAGSFGMASKTSTLGEVANSTNSSYKTSASLSLNGEPEDSSVVSNDAAADGTPLYAFSVAHPSWQMKLKRDVPTPELLNILAVPGGRPMEGSVELQFYLGPKGSGAPVHFHGHAINTLAYGEKRWFLFPPSDAFYSTKTALEFVQDDSRSSSAMQCTQQSGDIIYVPTLWGHATLNTKQSIGVAHEFSVEGFCME